MFFQIFCRLKHQCLNHPQIHRLDLAPERVVEHPIHIQRPQLCPHQRLITVQPPSNSQTPLFCPDLPAMTSLSSHLPVQKPLQSDVRKPTSPQAESLTKSAPVEGNSEPMASYFEKEYAS